MKLPYRYRGVTLLALLVVVLPWATWRFALYDTFAAWCDCRRLMRELKVTTPRNHGLQSFDGVCTDAPELIFSEDCSIRCGDMLSDGVCRSLVTNLRSPIGGTALRFMLCV